MILVTGATGMNGSAVTRELLRREIPVRALVRDRAKAAALGPSPSLEVVEGDMLREETLGRALDGVTRALMISSADPSLVATQVAFIGAAKNAGVQHIVKFSGKESNIGHDASRFRFTRMHEAIERALERSGVAWTHLRPSQFMQVFLREVPTIAGEGAIFLPFEPTQQFSPVDVEDIAKVACELLLRDGHESKSYDMTGPEALSLGDIAVRISEAAGKPVRVVTVTPADRRRALLAAGASAYFADALEEQTSERRRCPVSAVDLTTHRSFGVRPTPFAEFAKRHADAFRGPPSCARESHP
jgi:uncharacterized protein YbjT (DUF2867 family)